MRNFVIVALFLAVAAVATAQVTVTGSSPANLATGVSTNTTISIAFSAPIDTSYSFGPGETLLTNVDSVTGTYWSADRRTFYANAVLQPGTVYFVMVFTIHPAGGGYLQTPYLAYFTTAPSFPSNLFTVSGTITSGTTASLVVPLAGAAAAQQGWIAVTAPVAIQLIENGRVLGTSQGDAVAVPAGRHAIELVNAAVGYRETRSIDVAAGKMSPIAIEMPAATLSLNAVPWAEVWVDGQKVGDTPLGNLSLPAGPHEVLFRHPELGERRQTVVVKLPGPTRLSVDLTK